MMGWMCVCDANPHTRGQFVLRANISGYPLIVFEDRDYANDILDSIPLPEEAYGEPRTIYGHVENKIHTVKVARGEEIESSFMAQEYRN